MTHPDILKMERDGYLTESKACVRCHICLNDIYEGEEYFNIFGECVCDNCLYEWARKFMKTAGDE